MRKDQMPAGGCGKCGAYEGKTQSYLSKVLVWDGSVWICKKCFKEQAKEQENS